MRLPWMPRRERRMWRSAATLADLGVLVARWLEGEISSQAGYQPRYGPDPETEELIPVLAAACRGGYVTTASQPGCHEIGADGALWVQRAAVQGVVGDLALLRRLVTAAEDAGLEVVVRSALDRSGEGSTPVTTRDGEILTGFGGALTPRELRTVWGGCSDAALRAVTSAAQLAIADNLFGPSVRLWQVLAEVFDVPAGQVPPVPALPNTLATEAD